MEKNKRESKANSDAKALRKLTFVGFYLVLASLLVRTADAAPYAKTLSEAQSLASVALEKIRAEHKPYYTASYTHGDRDITYCAENCACLAFHFAPEFKSRGFDTRTIYLVKTSSEVGFRLKGPAEGIAGPQYFNYHYATAIRIGNDWYVVDPIATSSARFEPLETWKKRLIDPVIIQIKR